MPQLRPQVRIKTTEMRLSFPVEFVLPLPVSDGLLAKVREVDGVESTEQTYRYALQVRVGKLFDLRTVAEAVTRTIIAHFEWDPELVYLSLDGEPISLG